MSMRKLSNTISNDASINQLGISYMRDFSAHAANYNCKRTEESLILLNRSASLLSTTIQPQNFDPKILEVSKFFIDLHAVIGSLSIESDALWACVSLLQHCSRNLEARRAIIEEFRFVPLLANLLKEAKEKPQRLLVLLQELTYGIKISWEEPYLIVLLEQLVHIIYSATNENEETEGTLALSILINVCYKNFVVLFLFLRTVNISSFSRKIQNYGMLANKMLIVLSDDIHSPDEKQLHLFLRSTFAAIDTCIKDWNVPHLRHIVDFLLDSKAHFGLHAAMLNYSLYCEDVERLLDKLEANSTMNDSTEDARKQQQICMSLIFKLLRYIFQLSNKHIEGSSIENIVSVDSIVGRIFETACSWIESEVCGVQAVNLIEIMARLAKKHLISQRIARDPSILVSLITISEKPETPALYTIAILQLLLTLLHQAKTEKLILSKITESYFDKLFAPLLAIKPEMLHSMTCAISLEEIEKPIFCLLLLINFAYIAKKAYFEKCCTLLQIQQIQNALARSMLSGNEAVCRAVFQISQFEHFPQEQVAEYISKLNATSLQTPSMPAVDQTRNLNAIFKSHKSLVSKETEERLRALIDAISASFHNNQISNVATTQIIELFNYKIEKFSSSESRMQQRLEDASNEITNLTQRINLQNAELEKYHTMNFELHVKQESLELQYKDLKQQKDNLKRNNADLMKKLAEQSESLKISEKRLSVKVSELIVLEKEYKILKEDCRVKTEELEKLQATSRENSLRIEKLKKSIVAFEMDIKEKQHSIEEKDRELARTYKTLEEQKEAKKKSDDVITVLETQLQEKNEEIRNYERELSETEEMRKTVMSLMEAKKPKRK